MSPTVIRKGPYRFFFYAGDGAEPPHVHIERGRRVAKYWLDPVRLGANGGFGRSELGKIEKLVKQHATELLEAWNGYFNG